VAYRTPWWILAQTWQERGIRWKSGTRPAGTRNNKQTNNFSERLRNKSFLTTFFRENWTFSNVQTFLDFRGPVFPRILGKRDEIPRKSDGIPGLQWFFKTVTDFFLICCLMTPEPDPGQRNFSFWKHFGFFRDTENEMSFPMFDVPSWDFDAMAEFSARSILKMEIVANSWISTRISRSIHFKDFKH
jgi:hypothetical protein